MNFFSRTGEKNGKHLFSPLVIRFHGFVRVPRLDSTAFSGPGARFSKGPETFQARRQFLKFKPV